MKSLNNLIRALRLPFISVSVLPFILGSLLAKELFNPLSFFLGLFMVISVHLSANLINDYADSKSGVDWQDRNFYGFFGGSKLIQEKVFSENFYKNTAICFAILAVFFLITLAFRIRSISIIGFFSLILFLAWAYSEKPLQLSYRYFGEIIIFLLFGPALVMGGYFIQTKIFPNFESFMLSIPLGLFTTAVLFVNEIPDYADDERKRKLTWVNFTKPNKAFIIFYCLIALIYISVLVNIILGYLSYLSLLTVLLTPFLFKAAEILKKCSDDKSKFIQSSKLVIGCNTFMSIILIIDIWR